MLELGGHSLSTQSNRPANYVIYCLERITLQDLGLRRQSQGLSQPLDIM